jgi:hypothetical protein
LSTPAPATDRVLRYSDAAKGQEQTQLRLDGYYRPPLGRLGAGLDRALMHRVASATARTLRSVADALAEPGQGPNHHQEGTGCISAAPAC